MTAAITPTPDVKIRVVLIDDHEIVRAGLRSVLERDHAIEVCGEAGDANSGLDCVRNHRPDMAVVDISMPGLSGMDMIGRIHKVHAACRVVVYSSHDESLYAQRALRAGAHGYVMKSDSILMVRTAVQRIANGEIFLSPAMQHAALGLAAGVSAGVSAGAARGAGPAAPGGPSNHSNHLIHAPRATQDAPEALLSERELEILRLTGQGLSGTQIGEKLNRSAKTIDVHRQNIKQKLGLASAAELTHFAVRWQAGQSGA